MPACFLNRRSGLILLYAVLFLAFGLALWIPSFSQAKAKPYVSHPRLFPVYYQTNSDGPGELMSSLGFPYVFRNFSLRVNRPLVPGLVALVREALATPLLLAHLPAEWRSLQWGRWSAADTLATYFIWLGFNVFFLGAAIWLLYTTLSRIIGSDAALFAGFILLTTPIVLLSLREIHYGCLQILITAASISFWAQAAWSNYSFRKLIFFSFLIGLLFLGKLAASTYLAGAALFIILIRKYSAFAYIAAAALPTFVWIGICRILEIPYHFAEVSGYGQVVWLAEVTSISDFLHRVVTYAQGWAMTLWESMGLFHLILAGGGIWYLAKEHQYRLLLIIPFFATADFFFYLLIQRFHAVYGLHTMIFLFALAAKGLQESTARTNWSRQKRIWAGFACLLFIQVWLNSYQLPLYGG